MKRNSDFQHKLRDFKESLNHMFNDFFSIVLEANELTNSIASRKTFFSELARLKSIFKK